MEMTMNFEQAKEKTSKKMNILKEKFLKSNLVKASLKFYIKICERVEDALTLIESALFKGLLDIDFKTEFVKFAYEKFKNKRSSVSSNTKTLTLSDGIKRAVVEPVSDNLKYAAFVSIKVIVGVIIIALIILALFIFL